MGAAVIDLASEQVLKLSDVGRHLPPSKNGKPVSLSCALRWVLSGIKVPGTDEVVRLEAIRVGGRWLTSVEALQRFAERQTPVPGAPAVPSPRSRTQRQRAIERAERRLAEVGI